MIAAGSLLLPGAVSAPVFVSWLGSHQSFVDILLEDRPWTIFAIPVLLILPWLWTYTSWYTVRLSNDSISIEHSMFLLRTSEQIIPYSQITNFERVPNPMWMRPTLRLFLQGDSTVDFEYGFFEHPDLFVEKLQARIHDKTT